MKELTLSEVEDILVGCAVLGTGGGGNLEVGLEIMRKDYQLGKKVKLASLDELPKEGLIGTPYGCGAPKALDESLEDKYENLPRLEYPASILAFQRLEAYLDKKFVAVSSTELGGENTAEALHVACQLDLPLADADPAGRSVPELQHSTYFVCNKNIGPLSVATNFGETIIVENVINDFRAEEIVRSIAVASGDEVGVTDHPLKVDEYSDAIIPNAISYAQNIGKILREGNNCGRKIAEEIVNKNNGKLLFVGSFKKADWKCDGGFNIGVMELSGKDEFEKEEYKIFFKNENIIAYRNGEVEVTVPDLICMIDGKGQPITTPNFKDDMEMIIFALPSPEIWKTEKGLEVLGPKSFGFDLEYNPI